MLRIIFLSVISSSFALVTLDAEPTPTPAPSPQHRSAAKRSATTPSAGEGWSVANGVWTHPDGYKYVDGRVVRIGSQTHKRPPKPPTKAELDAAKGTTGASSATDAAAAKATERQRNLTPKPAPQTGTHL